MCACSIRNLHFFAKSGVGFPCRLELRRLQRQHQQSLAHERPGGFKCVHDAVKVVHVACARRHHMHEVFIGHVMWASMLPKGAHMEPVCIPLLRCKTEQGLHLLLSEIQCTQVPGHEESSLEGTTKPMVASHSAC